MLVLWMRLASWQELLSPSSHLTVAHHLCESFSMRTRMEPTSPPMLLWVIMDPRLLLPSRTRVCYPVSASSDDHV